MVIFLGTSFNYHAGFYLISGATDDGREDGAGGVISCETGLAHTGSIVDNQGSNFVVTHSV